MMRVLKAIITPLVLLSIIFSPLSANIAKAQPQNEAECKALGGTWTTRNGSSFCLGATLSETEKINAPSGAQGGNQESCEGEWISDPNIDGGGYCSGKKGDSSKGSGIISKQLNEGNNLNAQKIGACTIGSDNFLDGIIGSGVALLVTNIVISGLNGAPYIGGLVEPFDDALDQLNSAWLRAALWGTAASVIIFVESYLIQLAFLLNSNITTDNPVITTGFNVTLGIVNIGFVIFLVLIGIMTILRKSNWTAQKRLSNLIIAIILINFSLFIANLLLGISNTFTSALLANACATNLFDYLNVGNVFKLVQPAIGSVLNPLVGTGGIILAALFSITGALVLGALFLFLIIRYVMIVILLAFMPLAWLGFISPEINVPGIGNPWKKWWDEFTKWLVTGPIIAFSLYLTLTLLQNMGSVTSKATKIPLTGVALDGLLNITAALIMSLLGVFVAVKGSGLAGALIATGLGAGATLASRGIQTLGQRFGFGAATRYQERATRLESEARKERDKGNIDKAKAFEARAKEAANMARWSAQIGAAGQTMPVGLKQALDQAGIKGIPKDLEGAIVGGGAALDAARVWKTKAISDAGKEIGLDKKNEDEVTGEIQRLLQERRKTLIPGKRITIDNQLAAAYKHLADKGALHKLGDKEFDYLSNAEFDQHLAVMGVKIDPSKRFDKASAETALKDFNNATSKIEEIRRSIPEAEDPRRKQAEEMLNSIRIAAAEKLSKPDAFNSLNAGQQTLLANTILSSDFKKAVEKRGRSIQEFTDAYIKNLPLDQIAGQIATVQSLKGIQGIDDGSVTAALASAIERAKKTGKIESLDASVRESIVFDNAVRNEMNRRGIDPSQFEASVGMDTELRTMFDDIRNQGATSRADVQNKVNAWMDSINMKDFTPSAIFSSDNRENILGSSRFGFNLMQIDTAQEIFAEKIVSMSGKKGANVTNVLKKANAATFPVLARKLHDAATTNQLKQQIKDAANKRGINTGSW